METKAHWVLAGASAQEPVCRRQGGPVASGPGGSPARRVSAAAGFLLGRAVNLNGVFPHCVFLLLEDPGGGEGGGSAAEELLGQTQPLKSIRDSVPSLPWAGHRCTTVICKARVVISMDLSQHLLQAASWDLPSQKCPCLALLAPASLPPALRIFMNISSSHTRRFNWLCFPHSHTHSGAPCPQ